MKLRDLFSIRPPVTAVGIVTILVSSLSASDGEHGLYPAGSINASLGGQRVAVIFDDVPVVRAHVEGVRRQFFREAELLAGEQALDSDLRGRDLIFYGTWDHPWLARLHDRLPFRIGERRIEVSGRVFSGDQLRLICGLKNPIDPEHHLAVYVAADAAGIRGINNLFHGPTEWLVADGDRTLEAGSFDLVLDRASMERDLDALLRQIGAIHPAAVEAIPAAVIDAAQAARSELPDSMSRNEFAFVVNDILLALHDAHSSAAIGLSGERLRLPLRWLAEGLAISRDVDELRRGDQLVSLGGRSPDELMAGLRRLVPAENEWWIRHKGEGLLGDLAALAHLGVVTEPAVEARLFRDGQLISVAVKPGKLPADPSGRRPWVGFEIDEDASLGLFVLDQCRVDDTYTKTLRRFFQAVEDAGIERIAVDLRSNSGGNSAVTDEFLRYLGIDSFRNFGGAMRVSEEVIRQRGIQAEPGLHENPSGTRRVDRVADVEPFRGELFVLTGNGTFSSANWFAVVIQDNDLGEIVGEPPGNSPSCYGDILTLDLPESAVTCTLSFKRFVRPAPERDPADALTPDREIPLTLQDLLDDNDPVLEFLRSGEGG